MQFPRREAKPASLMGGSSKAPKTSDEQRRNERESLRIQQEQLKFAQKPLELPKVEASKPLPPQPPPASTSSADVAAAEEEARRKALNRTNAGRGTLFAGETGGYKGQTLGGQKTLLG